jgi:hypothetical protein
MNISSNVNERMKITVIGIAGLKIKFVEMVGKTVQYCYAMYKT